jgi:hypothetical protein
VALNTFYGDIAEAPLNPSEAIRLFWDPHFARLTAHFAASPEQFRWLYEFQVGGFIRDPEVREQFVPLLFRQFEDQPSSVGPFLQLNAVLIPAVLAATEQAGQLRTFPVPVRVAFGEDDTDLTPAYGRRLATLCAHGEATPHQRCRPLPPTGRTSRRRPSHPRRPDRIGVTVKAGTGAEGAAGIRCSNRNPRPPSVAVTGENTSGRGGTPTRLLAQELLAAVDAVRTTSPAP